MNLSVIVAWVTAVAAAVFIFSALATSETGGWLAVKWWSACCFTVTSLIFTVVAYRQKP